MERVEPISPLAPSGYQPPPPSCSRGQARPLAFLKYFRDCVRKPASRRNQMQHREQSRGARRPGRRAHHAASDHWSCVCVPRGPPQWGVCLEASSEAWRRDDDCMQVLSAWRWLRSKINRDKKRRRLQSWKEKKTNPSCCVEASQILITSTRFFFVD